MHLSRRIAVPLLVLSLLAVGCSSKPSTPATTGTAPEAAKPAQKITLKLAHDQNPDQGYGPGVAKFVETVKTKTNGAVEIQVFDRGTLGNERDVTEGLKLGSVDMAITTIGTMTNYEQQLALINMPFLFRDWDHVGKALESPEVASIFAKLEPKGFKALSVYAIGFRNIVTASKPITKAADLKGLKIRVPGGPVYVSTFKAMGANPTPVPWGDVYTSLQTKVVDGFENSAPVTEQFKMYEVAKNLAVSHHIWEGGALLISKSAWDKIPADSQKIIQDAAIESARYQRDLIRGQDDKTLENLKAKGMQITTLDPAQFAQAADSVYADLGQQYGIKDLITKIKNLK